jgi:hypothetical protein
MVRFLGLRGLSFGPKESLREITSTVGDVAPPIGSNGAKGGRMHGRIRGGGSSSNTSVTLRRARGLIQMVTPASKLSEGERERGRRQAR